MSTEESYTSSLQIERRSIDYIRPRSVTARRGGSSSSGSGQHAGHCGSYWRHRSPDRVVAALGIARLLIGTCSA